jgi:hypothetical protein
MTGRDGENPMTDAQRDEIKLLCREAEIPDKLQAAGRASPDRRSAQESLDH